MRKFSVNFFKGDYTYSADWLKQKGGGKWTQSAKDDIYWIEGGPLSSEARLAILVRFGLPPEAVTSDLADFSFLSPDFLLERRQERERQDPTLPALNPISDRMGDHVFVQKIAA